MIRRIMAIILSVLILAGTVPLAASAADFSAQSIVSDISEATADTLNRILNLSFGGSFVEWFLGLFGYFNIYSEQKLISAAGKNYNHEYTLKKDLTLSSTVKVTGTLNLKGGKTVKCADTCFDIDKNGSFSSNGITVISENGDAISNGGSCIIYGGDYKSESDGAAALRCREYSAASISGGTFTDLLIEGTAATVNYSGGETGEAGVKPDTNLILTGGHIGTVYQEGEFVVDGGAYDKIVYPAVIFTEDDLKKAAAEGGSWSVSNDLTVNSQINIDCKSLKIDGKGHTITMKNGKADSVVFSVPGGKELSLISLDLKNSAGGCVSAKAGSKIVVDKCKFESKGDTVVSCGTTQLSGGTSLKTTGTNTFSFKNTKSDKKETGEATLYYCNIGKISNDGKLNLMQSNTVVDSVINNGTVNLKKTDSAAAKGLNVSTAINNEGAVWNMSGGHVGTLSNHGKLSKTGGTVDTLKDNYLIYPTKVMQITQNYDSRYSHYNHSHSSDNVLDFPVDEACNDVNRSYFYCPCDEMEITRIYGVGNDGTNTIWLQSTSKVYFADGTTDYVTIMVIHPNDDTLMNLKVNQKFTRKEAIFLEGNDGNASGYHFHIAVGKGKMTGNGWTENRSGCWVLTTANGTCKPEKAFFIDTSFTKIYNRGNLNFKNMTD